MFLFIISSLVSLLTILVLFLQIKKIKSREIPSWFFGKTKKNPFKNKIKLNKPPILPIILLLIITICYCFAYFQQKNSFNKEFTSKSALIWLDPTISAKLTRLENKFNPELESEKILEFGYKNFGLENSSIFENGQIKIEFKIKELKSKNELIEFLVNQNNIVSPFTQPIVIDEVIKSLNGNENFFEKKSVLIAISDGNYDSMQGLFNLKKYFTQGILIKSKELNNLGKTQKEIIPTNLFSLWNEKNKIKEDFSIFNKFKSIIPQEARPQFIINNYNNSIDSFNILTEKDNKKTLPLFIACTNKYPSPIELDSFASLRTLVNFFGSNFIEKQCEKENYENLDPNKNIWKYRNAAVWVVQLNDQVISTMNDDLSFWIPEGFDPNFDSLVYTAGNIPHSDYIEETQAELKTIQMDPGNFPIQIPIIPPPPGAELGVRFPDDTRVYKGVFKPFYNSADGTSIAWKATSLPFFYLRTTTTTPNGELGRSRTWTHFWFEVANTLKQSNLSYIKLVLDDASRLREKLDEIEVYSSDKFSEILDLENLKFNKLNNFTFGLYKLENKNKFLLIAPKNDFKFNKTITVEDFSNNFRNPVSETNAQNKQKSISNSLFHILAAILGTISLIGLWWHQKVSIINILLFLCLFFYEKHSFASESFSFPFFPNNREYNKIEHENVPFRIAWCGKNYTLEHEKKYNDLRSTIMKRGTITFPLKIKVDACRPGEADVWWTDDFRELKIKELSAHISNGGIFILEGTKEMPSYLLELNDQSIGIQWESPKKRGMFYRSFYLLQSLDGCLNDSAKVLILRKKINAQAPFGLTISTHFLSTGDDCFKENNDYRKRSFVNIFYSFLTTDYKEDQIQLPEILNRIRNLGLEP
ncbi:hypothetical protein QEJ31_13795 [Pigmentibacter sp. JX0631]|uniref:hypothetical protein n=1 Tax=Pigmentibacter sp. JX0631 TaxID=2976982 RepID=UPI0024690195|nr:hypothetical protein [Pigmentibacter sp. JX0631]WGL59599.1 hypothetical protein QEJ31_13795 [Pigmentibacter sp. JX0631]